MTYLAWLDSTIAAQLARDPIGRPVFLRASLQLTADHGLLAPILAAQLETAARWMATPVRRLYAQGGERQGFLSVLAEFDDGQTALISSELTHGGEASADLLLLGQRGSFRFQDQPEPLQLREPPAANQALAAALARSLGAGKPVSLAKE
jgi:hypothetical protein